MANFKVTFKNGLDENGCTCEFPTDELNANGATIEDFSLVESDIREGENFARETWEYEVDDAEADMFGNGLDSTPTVISWKREQ